MIELIKELFSKYSLPTDPSMMLSDLEGWLKAAQSQVGTVAPDIQVRDPDTIQYHIIRDTLPT